MPTQGLDIGLQIRNNTNYPQQINVMGNPANLLDTANATTEYRWDLTGFTITFENTISVQYKRNTDPTFDTFTWDLDGTSLQGVVIALNNLGIGYFNLYDELGSTYIGTYNQNYAFGDLNIFNPSISTTTTTTTTTIAPTTTTTTTSTTTAAPTSTTTTTTTAAPTSTTTTTTTAAPTTSTTTSTTTNLVYSQFTLGYSALNGNDSCAEFVLTPTSFYAVGGTITLVNGTILYTDTGLTTLVPNGFYSNGSDNWSVVSGNGTLSAQNSCALTTTTTTSTTTAAPTTTSTTSTTTTAAPTTTSTTSTTTTAAPTTTSTTSTTTTAAPTTTSTTTSTTTLPVYSFCLGYDASSQPTACLDYVNCQTTTTSTTTTTTTGAPVPYTIDNAATGSSALACAGATTTSTVYALAGYTVPIVGMIFYDSPSLTTPFIGSVGWRKFTYDGVIFYAGEVDINGELTNYVTCP
jgi:hypothetical protein